MTRADRVPLWDGPDGDLMVSNTIDRRMNAGLMGFFTVERMETPFSRHPAEHNGKLALRHPTKGAAGLASEIPGLNKFHPVPPGFE